MAAFRDYLVSVSRDRHMRLFPCICTFRYLVEASNRSFYCVLLEVYYSFFYACRPATCFACLCVSTCVCERVIKMFAYQKKRISALHRLHFSFPPLAFQLVLPLGLFVYQFVRRFLLRKKENNQREKCADFQAFFLKSRILTSAEKKKEFINKNGQRQAFR